MAYTYLIGWTKTNKWYYGVRYAEKSTNDDLWKTYFTSSRYVKDYRKQFGEPDVVQIRKIFCDPQIAIKCEDRVIRKLRLFENSNFLNKAYSGSIYYDDEVRAKISNHAKKPRSEAFKRARSKAMKQLWKQGIYANRPPQTEDHKRKNSEGLKRRYAKTRHHSAGQTQSRESNKKRSQTLLQKNALLSRDEKRVKFAHVGAENGMYGKKHDGDTRDKIRQKALDRPKLECEHCGKIVTYQSYGRYHKERKCKLHAT